MGGLHGHNRHRRRGSRSNRDGMTTAGGHLGTGGPQSPLGSSRAGLRGPGQKEGTCLSFPPRQIRGRPLYSESDDSAQGLPAPPYKVWTTLSALGHPFPPKSSGGVRRRRHSQAPPLPHSQAPRAPPFPAPVKAPPLSRMLGPRLLGEVRMRIEGPAPTRSLAQDAGGPRSGSSGATERYECQTLEAAVGAELDLQKSLLLRPLSSARPGSERRRGPHSPAKRDTEVAPWDFLFCSLSATVLSPSHPPRVLSEDPRLRLLGKQQKATEYKNKVFYCLQSCRVRAGTLG